MFSCRGGNCFPLNVCVPQPHSYVEILTPSVCVGGVLVGGSLRGDQAMRVGPSQIGLAPSKSRPLPHTHLESSLAFGTVSDKYLLFRNPHDRAGNGFFLSDFRNPSHQAVPCPGSLLASQLSARRAVSHLPPQPGPSARESQTVTHLRLLTLFCGRETNSAFLTGPSGR